METANSLIERIDAEFSAAEQRWDQLRVKQLEVYQVRQQRLECFERIVETLRELWEPRLDALSKRFGKNMDVLPIQERGRRAVSLEFGSNLARILLRFAVSPDADARKLVVTYDVEILPVLMKFDSHRELELPLDAVDKAQLAQWLDDRVVDFVHTYLAVHENEYYLKEKMVEDPIAKVRFPKFAAAAKLEHDGGTMYFIDESTLREFQQRAVDCQS
jgi:YHS domain-containing protein